MNQPDYIIVGAGSAGCVLANRLSANGKYNIAVLEAGGSDRRFWIQLPIGYGKTFFDERINWKYQTQPESGLNGRTSYWPRGKVLGGSSSINAMVYVRGNHADFDDWADKGNPGWSAADVMPYFDRFEARDGSQTSGSGDLHITDTQGQIHPLCDNFLNAAVQSGFTRTSDFNLESFEGVGRYDITTKGGVRHSTARAFLRPALKRSNVQLHTYAHVTRVLFNGTHATGIEYNVHGELKTLTAKKEVILCGGSINSPQLLELSGVGDASRLQELGIPVVSDLQAVGQNLQDHIGINYYYKSRVPTINDQLSPLSGKIKAGLKYILTRRGLLSLSVNQVGGFVKSRPGLSAPNLQLYFSPVSYTRAPKGTRPLIKPDPYSAFLLSFQPSRPTSRGHVHITVNNPFEAPKIQPNYLSTNDDINDVLDGCRLMRTLANSPALKDIILEEQTPGVQVQSDEALLEDFKQRGDSVFHPVSTCIMGSDAANSVVDHALRVYGTTGLRVIDASIFPNLTSGNTNAPTIMVAEKGAELVLKDAEV